MKLCLLFELADTVYAADEADLERVEPLGVVTPAPGAPEEVLGVRLFQGKAIPIVDLRRRLGLPPKRPEAHSRMLVARVGGRRVGFLIDKVRGLIRTDAGKIQPLPEGPTGQERQLLKGVLVLDEGSVGILNPAAAAAPRPAGANSANLQAANPLSAEPELEGVRL